MARGARRKGGGGRLGLAEPRWALSLGLAALTTAAVCWPAWPGYMSYDSVLAWSQSIEGVKTATWPPLHTYLFGLSRAAHAGPWGLFLAQTFLLFAGANLTLSLASRRTAVAVALMALFVAAFGWVTPQLGVLMTHWRDVTTTSFAVAGLALWLLAARYRALALTLVALAAFGASAALRYNALPLIVFLLALAVRRPLGGERIARPAQALVVGVLVVSLGLAFASMRWRLPDLRPLPAGHNAMVIQQFDLIGISACAGRDELPAGMGQASVAQIRAGYDPRHLNLSLRQAHLSKLPPTDANARLVATAWREALAGHPLCYLKHREAVFAEQMGLKRGHLFYPTHGAIDPNPFGLSLAHPKASAWLTGQVLAGATPTPRRAFWLYLIALPLALLAWRRRGDPGLVALALAGGAWAYAGLLFLAGPAADARYIFPSTVFCALAILIAAAALLPKRLAG